MKQQRDQGQIANWWHLTNWLGVPSSIYIAKKLDITDRHARRLIHEARQNGLIPATTKRNNNQ
jgi:DNA-binding transcriptional regulator LsrR (DeoR family)